MMSLVTAFTLVFGTASANNAFAQRQTTKTENVETVVPFVAGDPNASAKDTYPNNWLSNDYIDAHIYNDGDFTMGTTLGNPGSADDYRNMLFNHPAGTTSETTVRVDGVDHDFSANQQVAQTTGKSNTAVMVEGDIKIKQIISLYTNPENGKEDIAQIQYLATNEGTTPHQVGLRIMMDTMLVGNDGAKFRTDDAGAIITEREFSGASVPRTWRAFDDLASPNLITNGIFYTNPTERPDKVQFVQWGGISSTQWDYAVTPERPIVDSAVAAYYNPVLLNAGQSKTFTTYYGLSQFAGQSTDGDFSVGVFAPTQMVLNDTEDDYANNPISVTAYFNNETDSAIASTEVQLSLPTGMTLAQGSTAAATSLASLASGGEAQITWLVDVERQASDTTLNYSVLATPAGLTLQTLSLTLATPKAVTKRGIIILPDANVGVDYRDLTNALTAEFSSSETTIEEFAYDATKTSVAALAADLATHVAAENYQEVVLVAHSFGGLVGADYMAQSPENLDKVKKFISIGTPFLGVPLALQVSLDIHTRHFNLIPPSQYNSVGGKNYAKRFETRTIGGQKIDHFVNMTDAEVKTQMNTLWPAYTTALADAQVMYTRLFKNSLASHVVLDTDSYFIVGYDQSTVQEALMKDYGVYDVHSDFQGDGLVPLYSATVGNLAPTSKTFYIPEKYHQLEKNADVIALVQSLISRLSSDTTSPTIPVSITQVPPGDKFFATKIKVECPVDVIVTQAGLTVAQIANNALIPITPQAATYIAGPDGDTKIVYLVDSVGPTVGLTGTDTGTMTYTVQEFNSTGGIAETARFENIPITATTRMSNTPTVGEPLMVDETGNGTFTSVSPTYSSGTKVAVTIGSGVGGSITKGTSGDYPTSQLIEICAIPATGYTFSNWTTSSGGAFESSTSASTYFLTSSESTIVKAVFVPVTSGSGNNENDNNGSGNTGGGSSSGGDSSSTPSTPATPTIPTTTKASTDNIELQLPYTDLANIQSAEDASKLVKQAVDSMTDAQKKSESDIDLVMRFTEDAIKEAVAVDFATGDILVDKALVANASEKGVALQKEMTQTLGKNGLRLDRDLDVNLLIKAKGKENFNAMFDKSVLQVSAQNISVENEEVGVTVNCSNLEGEMENTERLSVSIVPEEQDVLGLGNNTESVLVAKLQTAYAVSFSNEKLKLPVKVQIPGLQNVLDENMTIVDKNGVPVVNKYNPTAGRIEFKCMDSDTYAVKQVQKDFSDIQSKSAEMKKAIQYLANKGIVMGTSTQNFSADKQLSRAEITSLLMRAIGKIDKDTNSGFTDVPSTMWCSNIVGSAKKLGLVKGATESLFSPNDTLRKDQATVLYSRVLKIERKFKDVSTPEQYLSTFADNKSIPDWAKKEIAMASREGLVIKRQDGKFLPDESMTRGEAALVIYKLFQLCW